MTKTASKTTTDSKSKSDAKTEMSNHKQVQAKRSFKSFKPDIRVAELIVGAIAFLQKSGFQANTRTIKTCIVERQRKNFQRSLTELPKYLNRGVELGILKKRNKTYKLGELRIRNRKPRRSSSKRYGQTIETIKAVETVSKAAGQSATTSAAAVAAF